MSEKNVGTSLAAMSAAMPQRAGVSAHTVPSPAPAPTWAPKPAEIQLQQRCRGAEARGAGEVPVRVSVPLEVLGPEPGWAPAEAAGSSRWTALDAAAGNRVSISATAADVGGDFALPMGRPSDDDAAGRAWREPAALTLPGSAAEPSRAVPPACVFRRSLTATEIAQVEALLDPLAFGELQRAAAREFDWALSVSGHVPGAPGRLDYPSALTAMRQVAYLNGLPALDAGAARWFFDAHAARAGSEDGPDLVLEEFHAALVHLLQATLAAEQRPPGISALAAEQRPLGASARRTELLVPPVNA